MINLWWQLREPLLILCDAILINLALLVSYFVRFDGNMLIKYLANYYQLALIVTPVMLTVFFFSKIYRRVWAYASIGELLTLLKSITFGSMVVIFASYMLSTKFPRSIILLFWAFGLIFIGGSRFAWRLYVEKKLKLNNGDVADKSSKKVLIYGAGDAGVMVAREFKSHYNGHQPVVGFIDDDQNKHCLTIHGIPVLGGRKDIAAIVEKYLIAEVIIAMPSVSGAEIQKVVEAVQKHVSKINILPGVYQLLDGKITLNKIRPLEIEDLLGREPVEIDLQAISGYIKNKVVLITGAGGSIGSELCRQVALLEPQKLVLLGHGENSIHHIWLELKQNEPSVPLGIEIADVRDKDKLQQVFDQYKPNVVFHAAAHKHVPLMEMHPDEAIKTNVFGTKNVAEMADRYQADVFIMISTDKAVNPSSVMGASKRLAELMVQNLFRASHTKFAAVRFGNVLGSRGSVVPIFKEQIAKGGPVTVTHPEMKRYFMTIPEAVQLVIQAGAMANGGELFLLDMGQPVKIVDLAKNMIKLSGFEPEKEIKITYTGIRPGEKLFEELLTAEEGSTRTKHKRIYISKTIEINRSVIEEELCHLSQAELTDANEIFIALQKLVPDFISYREK